MSTITTRANSVKEKTAETPSAPKSDTIRNTVKDNENPDTCSKFGELNLEGLSSEEKLDFVYKHVAELTFYARERAKDIELLKAENAEQDRKIQALDQTIKVLEQRVELSEKNRNTRNL